MSNDAERPRAYLHSLPEPVLPARVLDTLRGERLPPRSRPTRRLVWLAAAAAVAALAVGVQRFPAPDPEPASSQALANPTLDPALLAELRALDRNLAASYARGAGSEHLEPLWQTRRALVARAQQPDLPTPRPVRL